MTVHVKYPRTAHLPWSPGAAGDDVRADGISGLDGREVVVTEKMDGENTTIYRDGWHARSLDSSRHPSRSRVAALAAATGPGIPEGYRVNGENLYARHSVGYDSLSTYFLGFAVWDGETCLDWDATAAFLAGLGIAAVPVLWRGRCSRAALQAVEESLDLGRQEGFVVRDAGPFTLEEFPRRVAKWVRPGHVQTGPHWMSRPVVPNRLRGPGRR